MTAAPYRIDTLRRGACPSLAAPMQTGDGLLVRLRPAAPALTADDLLALAGLARETGNGLIEITARGNIQLRGLTGASVPRLAQGLAAAGIVPQTGVAIETPALSGIDPSEIADATPMADALRAAIAAAGLTLAPKLAIVVDGGGVLSLADMVADIRLDAVEMNDALVWRLSVGGDRETARFVAVLAAESAVDGTMAVVAALAAIGPATRGRDLDVPALAADLPFSPVGRTWPEGSGEGACSPVGVCAPLIPLPRPSPRRGARGEVLVQIRAAPSDRRASYRRCARSRYLPGLWPDACGSPCHAHSKPLGLRSHGISSCAAPHPSGARPF